MITEATTVADLLSAAAIGVAGTLASGEPLAPGEPIVGGDADIDLDGAHAVLVPFSGPLAGEFALLVDGELGQALKDTPLGELDLTSALGPTAEAIANSLGSVVLGPLEVLEASAALRRVLGSGEAGLVPLIGSSGVRAAVALSLVGAAGRPVNVVTPAQAAATSAAVSSASVDFVPSPDRLDVLRAVEMSATAELGRVRMTINDLLSLRDGAVIELDRAAGAPADLYVNGRLIAKGEVVVVDENYGLRITQVVTDADNR